MRNTLLLLILLGTAPKLSAQSLWDNRQPQPSLFADTTARGVGDILTVIINESQRIKNKEDTEFTRNHSLDFSLKEFNILPKAFNPLPTVKSSNEDTTDSTGQYDKQGSLITQMGVVVIDVLPNGNMVVEGRRRIVMDKETKTLRLTGIVRPYDVTGSNTVLSSQVANASISYEGKGPLTRITNHGWLGGLIDMIWPF